ncbi:hypothetical protein B5S33_g665 [[Candida] boidinii]|nr:hypothetical protein B5S30_g58 [[Candida] boidinii]OWB82044.1 hypothetical protein B5S33_g665 [[Candida] boidinii]
MNRNGSDAPTIISIIGTTGVGKSKFGIELAKLLNGEIINADSMQMYKGADIITNKHPIAERDGIPHHVMNHVNWDEEYHIHRFKSESISKINDITSRGKIPIIVGGTHYYLQSLLFSNKTIETTDDNFNNSSTESEVENKDDKFSDMESRLTEEENQILNGPSSELIKHLKSVDPKVAEKFHPNDTRRIRRALEIYYLTKIPTSEFYSLQKNKEKTETSLRFKTIFFWLYSDQQILDKRLDERVDDMMKSGAITELQELYDYYRTLNPAPDCERGVWQVIGFKEFLPWLTKESNLKLLQGLNNEAGEVSQNSYAAIMGDKDFERCLDDMKLRTRRYSRRQVKWIKNLLIPELNNEAELGFPSFGKTYLLDASDLEKWNSQVKDRGVQICKQFLATGKVPEDIKQQPNTIQQELITPPSSSEDLSELRKSKEQKWKHYTCDICTDPDSGEPLIFVGEQFNLHLKSKKHKRVLNKGKRKREYEEWLALNENKKKEMTKEVTEI